MRPVLPVKNNDSMLLTLRDEYVQPVSEEVSKAMKYIQTNIIVVNHYHAYFLFILGE